jgi:transposase
MAEEARQCPHGHSEGGVKDGRASNGKARYRCQQTETGGRTCMRAYAEAGRIPPVKRQMVEMARNGSGGRDTARVRQVRPSTGMGE